MKPLLILLALALPAAARIGETKEQLIARYGPISSEASADTFFFRKSGIFIRANMLGGICQGIMFSPYALDENGKIKNGEPLSSEQITALLASNAGGSKWGPINDSGASTEDGKLHAAILPNQLVIQTSEYGRFEAAEKDRKEKERLNGF